MYVLLFWWIWSWKFGSQGDWLAKLSSYSLLITNKSSHVTLLIYISGLGLGCRIYHEAARSCFLRLWRQRSFFYRCLFDIWFMFVQGSSWWIEDPFRWSIAATSEVELWESVGSVIAMVAGFRAWRFRLLIWHWSEQLKFSSSVEKLVSDLVFIFCPL